MTTDKEKILAKIQSLLNETNYEPFTDEVLGKIDTCKSLLSFINTLEEKDVDLEKHLKEDIEDVFFDLDGVAVKGATHYITVEDVKDIAKYFFELGCKANSFDATVCKAGNTYLKEMDKDAIAKALEPFKDGDKVKVLIIKND